MQWRIVPDFSNYEVSEFGAIRRATDLLMPAGHIKYPVGTILKPKTKNRSGYLTYRLVDGEKRKTLYAHKIVAMAFLENKPTSKHEICHIDGNRYNNHYLNLRWGTHKENMQDAMRHGTHYACLRRRRSKK